MSRQVLVQVLPPGEFLITLRALVGFFTGMRSFVKLPLTSLSKALIAVAALVWLLPGVCSLMAFQTVAVNKRLVALIARVWLVSSVGTHVNSSACFLRKCH